MFRTDYSYMKTSVSLEVWVKYEIGSYFYQIVTMPILSANSIHKS